MLAVIATVQVKLLVPEFSITHLLTHYPTVDIGMFSGPDKNIGCALSWVIIARDSESEYPFYPVGQLCRICAGH